MKPGELYRTKEAYDGTYIIIKLTEYLGRDVWEAVVVQDNWGDAPFNTLVLGEELFEEYVKIKQA